MSAFVSGFSRGAELAAAAIESNERRQREKELQKQQLFDNQMRMMLFEDAKLERERKIALDAVQKENDLKIFQFASSVEADPDNIDRYVSTFPNAVLVNSSPEAQRLFYNAQTQGKKFSQQRNIARQQVQYAVDNKLILSDDQYEKYIDLGVPIPSTILPQNKQLKQRQDDERNRTYVLGELGANASPQEKAFIANMPSAQLALLTQSIASANFTQRQKEQQKLIDEQNAQKADDNQVARMREAGVPEEVIKRVRATRGMTQPQIEMAFPKLDQTIDERTIARLGGDVNAFRQIQATPGLGQGERQAIFPPKDTDSVQKRLKQITDEQERIIKVYQSSKEKDRPFVPLSGDEQEDLKEALETPESERSIKQNQLIKFSELFGQYETLEKQRTALLAAAQPAPTDLERADAQMANAANAPQQRELTAKEFVTAMSQMSPQQQQQFFASGSPESQKLIGIIEQLLEKNPDATDEQLSDMLRQMFGFEPINRQPASGDQQVSEESSMDYRPVH